MKYLTAFFVVMFLLMSFTVFTNAVWDGPYYAYANIDVEGNWLIAKTKARGTALVRDGSYMCSIGMEVDPVSDNEINGAFSDGVSHMRLRNNKKMCADSSSWGSDNKDKHWSATDTSCAT